MRFCCSCRRREGRENRVTFVHQACYAVFERRHSLPGWLWERGCFTVLRRELWYSLHQLVTSVSPIATLWISSHASFMEIPLLRVHQGPEGGKLDATEKPPEGQKKKKMQGGVSWILYQFLFPQRNYKSELDGLSVGQKGSPWFSHIQPIPRCLVISSGGCSNAHSEIGLATLKAPFLR